MKIVTKLRGGRLLIRPMKLELGLHPVVVELRRLLKQVERFGQLLPTTERDMLRRLTQARYDVDFATRKAIWGMFNHELSALLGSRYNDAIKAEMQECILPDAR